MNSERLSNTTEILDQDLDTEASEELELMQEMQAGDISQEQVDIEQEVEVEEEEIDMKFDIEESQPSL